MEKLTAKSDSVKSDINVLWRFWGTYCFHIQVSKINQACNQKQATWLTLLPWRWRQHVPPTPVNIYETTRYQTPEDSYLKNFRNFTVRAYFRYIVLQCALPAFFQISSTSLLRLWALGWDIYNFVSGYRRFGRIFGFCLQSRNVVGSGVGVVM
jgi:hypothetical protein